MEETLWHVVHIAAAVAVGLGILAAVVGSLQE